MMLSLNPQERRTVEAVFERMFPTDADSPGAAAIGVVDYVDRALAGAYQDHKETYRHGLAALDRAAQSAFHASFSDLRAQQQDTMIEQLENGTLLDFLTPDQQTFFALLRNHLQEGLFADPLYGGNKNKLGWRVLGHPGVWLENSAEENLTPDPVTKGGRVQSMADLGFSLEAYGNISQPPAEHADYVPQLGAVSPSGPADVVIVGVGAMGGIIAPILANAGLKIVGLEAGPYRTRRDFIPDELGHTYYCRASMGPKFEQETPRWRKNADELTQEATFSLGRMMNSVGGSVIHYGAWLRRFHPHHFRPLTRIKERWGLDILPDDATVVDWPISYEELEPYYTSLEYLIGVAGDDDTPFMPRSKGFPMRPMRPFRLGEAFAQVTRDMGYHPYFVPVGMNTTEYDGRPATTYTAWSNGFGSYNDAKWHPGLSSVPEALATGNFELRTHCRVVKILTDAQGQAAGVEYIDANGNLQTQEARTVILAGYTFENIRLMFLSGDPKHPNGLGNNTGQLGQNFMTKMFAHVDGFMPDKIWNRHTGPAAQGIVLDDFLADDFDSMEHGFIGGATLGVEQQFLPLQISREALPHDVPCWGAGYKNHLKEWQHFGVVRIQPDTLPYCTNFVDLDPIYRDRSGLGLPVVRITYDMRDNEQRLADWMEGKSEEILRAMSAAKTWRGPRFTGVGSSHDLGGCRMGEDPNSSVVSADLAVHDTPGLYVFGGSAFVTCPGINPTLTIWAIVVRAAERLVDGLKHGG